jgi:fatty acid desaturase
MIPMMLTISQRLQAYFGWCPNSPGVHVQASDRATGRVAPGIADPEPPHDQTIPTRIAMPAWMTVVALAILFATLFVGGNIWWPVFVFAVLVIFLIIHIRTQKNTGGGQ